VAADNAFDQELAERARIREQAAAEERAAQAAADALRAQNRELGIVSETSARRAY
jgi:hypothetical protein